MIVIAALLTHATLLGGPGARLLARARWVTRFPQVTLRCWHACALGLFASLAAALVLVAHDVWEHGMVWLFHADKPLVHAAYGGAWQVAGIAEAALLALLLGAVTLSILTLRRSLRLRRERDRYRLTADTQGAYDRTGDPTVRVLRHPAPAAFCIPGPRGGDRIVVTTAAQDMLSRAELAATVEHERAHLRLRHHRAILAADILTTAIAWTGLLRGYADQVRRLAEMAADDQAARKHGRRTVASALLEMCTVTGPAADPSDLPAMTGPDPAERIRRLITTSPVPAGSLAPALTLAVATAALTLPVVLCLAPAAFLADTAHLAAR
ncbi:M56 family metallopeptidase [Streptomyces yatensis]|uniref:Peptidase M48 domain-containing protein n=1 Tax=Streptomyces yatensis TaxID=155177 RepID=A0ABN2IMK8_9ACTN|nr:M56 family metallopeptidase [Streptomyces yatensis]